MDLSDGSLHLDHQIPRNKQVKKQISSLCTLKLGSQTGRTYNDVEGYRLYCYSEEIRLLRDTDIW